MLLAPEIHQDFIDRLDKIDSLLDKAEPPYIAMAAERFADIEGDLATIFPDGRVYTVENDNFVERLLKVWSRLKTS